MIGINGAEGRAATARPPHDADWGTRASPMQQQLLHHHHHMEYHQQQQSLMRQEVVSIGSTPYSSSDPIDVDRSASDVGVGGPYEAWTNDGGPQASCMRSEPSGSMPPTPGLYHLTSTVSSPGFSLLPSPTFSPSCGPHPSAP
eukprot:CAMPEP_0169471688 /NCGR_PEP_ID=MMETSP1042-20121227/24733_1 /TAXON_ID=464988 /ORGANISM="Hemiselmis andersenii, Strain CCMP1180" /LENGTH=142 /DNA_ID=CAMNT_0009585421 /DNA_START=1 /DNA_END=425 /DNA_ORIENTATION=+